MTTYATPFDTAKDFYCAYWAAFETLLLDQSEGWLRKPVVGSYWTLFPLHRPGVHLAAAILMPKRSPRQCGIRVELSLVKAKLRKDGETFHSRLRERRADVEASIGAPLDWESNTHNQYQIGLDNFDCDPTARNEWDEQHRWMLRWLRRFNEVFGART